MTDSVKIENALSALTDRQASVLVTGANGFIGRALCRTLASVGISFIEFDRHFDGDPPPSCATRVAGDIADASQVDALFAAHRISHVVHGGGISGAAVAPGKPKLIHTVNVLGTINMLDAALLRAVDRFVLLSSIAAYGDQPTLDPVAEEVSLRATDYYGASKLASEKIAQSYRDTAKLDVIALRLASAYGPGRRVPCIVGALYESARSGQAVVVSAANKNPRQLIYIDDCVDAIVLSLAAPPRPRFAYNIATGHCVAESEIAAEASAIDPRVIYTVSDEDRFYDSHLGPLLMQAAKNELGFEAAVGLGAGLRSYWRVRQQNQT